MEILTGRKIHPNVVKMLIENILSTFSFGENRNFPENSPVYSQKNFMTNPFDLNVL